jgi:DNA-binding HxlR family transcriptional regulator/peroxiredoxin
MRFHDAEDSDCAIAQALAVVGDWWTLLVVRELAGGVTRFGELADGLGVSRKVLTERLNALVEHGLVRRSRYSDHPPRFDYLLTDKGRGLLPVLIALQNWGQQHVLGDGSVTAAGVDDSLEARRIGRLVGQSVPRLTLASARGGRVDPVDGDEGESTDARWIVLYCFPGAFAPGTGTHPPGWDRIPGAPGCTLEATTFRDRFPEFTARSATVHGVSTQRPDELAAFVSHLGIPFAMISDQDLVLATALRLPTFRAGGVDRLKRLTLIVDRQERRIARALYPVSDPVGAIEDALSTIAPSRRNTRRRMASDEAYVESIP